MLRGIVCVSVLMICMSLNAEEEHSVWPSLPQVLLKDALAVMHINKPHHLMDHLEDAATEAGVSVDEAHRFIAQRMYHSRSLDGIDMGRPSVFLWRQGRAPLVAIIPIKDRAVFQKNFGRVLIKNAMMIRTGENKGTTIYKQNTNRGMVEYRMLIRDQTAYIGRSPAECNLLADIKIQEEPSKPMFRYYIDKPYDFLPQLKQFFENSKDALEAELISLVTSESDLLLQQVKTIAISADIDAKKNFQLDCVVEPVKDTTLALWTARQQNQSSRLLPLLGFEKSSLMLYGNINWAGGIKETGNRIAKFIDRYGSDLMTRGTVAKALSSWSALRDRQASFAYSLQLRAGKNQELDVFGDGISEQTRAIELLGYQQILDAFIAKEAVSSKMTHLKDVKVGDLQNLGDNQGYWESGSDSEKQTAREIHISTQNHLLSSWGVQNEKSISERCLSIIPELEKSVSPIGEAGIVVLHMNLHNVLREISNLSGSIGYQIDDAELTAALRLNNDRHLSLNIQIPLAQAAKSIRASDWTAVVQKIEALAQLYSENSTKK